MTIDEARGAVRLADDALGAFTKETEALCRRAREAIIAERADETGRLKAIAREANNAFRATLVEQTPAHDWLGRKVTRKVSKGWGYSRNVTTEVGIVEQRRLETAFPANAASYSLPPVGGSFVRALKKDGTTGSRVLDKTVGSGWEPVE